MLIAAYFSTNICMNAANFPKISGKKKMWFVPRQLQLQNWLLYDTSFPWKEFLIQNILKRTFNASL